MHPTPFNMQRRHLLLAAVAGGFRPAFAQSFVDPGDSRSFAVEEVGDGVLAFLAPTTVLPVVSGNSMAIIGRESVLVVDTGHFPSLARKMVERIRQATNRPVKWVMNTHWHPDHFTGNAVYRDAFPGVKFVATRATLKRFEQGWGYNDPKPFAGPRAMLQRRLDEGKGADGAPLTPVMRGYFAAEIREIDNAQREWKQVDHVAPDVIVRDRLDVDLGSRTVQLMFLGRANTEGDLVAFDAATRTLATGDVLVAPLPYCYGSFITEWAAVLARMEAMGARVIVPGHGPVQRDTTYIHQVRRLLESMAAQAKAAVARGDSLESFQGSADLEPFHTSMVRGDFFQERMWKDSVVNNGLKRAWREAKDGPLQDED